MLHKADLYSQKKHRSHPFRLYSPFQDVCRKKLLLQSHRFIHVFNQIYVSGERGIIYLIGGVLYLTSEISCNILNMRLTEVHTFYLYSLPNTVQVTFLESH